ncbi:hypothetical protein AGMMS49938_03960 [Fibrobacterales bacterium]|nr:hypothetical protein AGMMS49938_03960 [Fibrobacterales bacterium]
MYKLILLFAFAALIFSCSDGTVSPTGRGSNGEFVAVESDAIAKTILGKWTIEDPNSPYASIEFTEYGYFVAIERPSLLQKVAGKVTALFKAADDTKLGTVHIGTYAVSTTDDGTITLTEIGPLTNVQIDVKNSRLSFTIEDGTYVASDNSLEGTDDPNTKKLTRVWSLKKVTIDEIGNNEVDGGDAPSGLTALFSRAGTYLVLTDGGTKVGVSEWEWNGVAGTEINYSWNNWKNQKKIEVKVLGADKLVILEDSYYYHFELVGITATISSSSATLLPGTVLTAVRTDATGLVGEACTYEWKREGVEEPVGTDPTYTLQTTDVGKKIYLKYLCGADDNYQPENYKDVGNAVTATIMPENPVITQLLDKVYSSDQTATLAPTVSNQPTYEGLSVSYGWDCTGANSKTIEPSTGANTSITLNSPQNDSPLIEGNTTCIATVTYKVNSVSSSATTSAVVKVPITPLVTIANTYEFNKGESDNNNISVTVTNEAIITGQGGVLTYKWYKDGTPGTTLGTGATFQVPTGTSGVSQYKVEVTNSVTVNPGTVASNTETKATTENIQVTIKAEKPNKPTISPATVSFADKVQYTTAIGSGNIFNGTAPTPIGTTTYQWYKNGTTADNLITGATAINYNPYTAENFPTANVSDQYYLVVKNTEGGQEAFSDPSDPVTFTFTQIGTPEPTIIRDLTTPILTCDPVITGGVGDEANLTYQWFLSGSSDPIATGKTFNGFSTTPGTYNYTCKVTNTLHNFPTNGISAAAAKVIVPSFTYDWALPLTVWSGTDVSDKITLTDNDKDDEANICQSPVIAFTGLTMNNPVRGTYDQAKVTVTCTNGKTYPATGNTLSVKQKPTFTCSWLVPTILVGGAVVAPAITEATDIDNLCTGTVTGSFDYTPSTPVSTAVATFNATLVSATCSDETYTVSVPCTNALQVKQPKVTSVAWANANLVTTSTATPVVTLDGAELCTDTPAYTYSSSNGTTIPGTVVTNDDGITATIVTATCNAGATSIDITGSITTGALTVRNFYEPSFTGCSWTADGQLITAESPALAALVAPEPSGTTHWTDFERCGGGTGKTITLGYTVKVGEGDASAPAAWPTTSSWTANTYTIGLVATCGAGGTPIGSEQDCGTVTVTPPLPSITLAENSYSYKQNQTTPAITRIEPAVTGAVSTQWKVCTSNDRTTGCTDVSTGTVDGNYFTPSVATTGTFYYHLEATNASGTVKSERITVTVLNSVGTGTDVGYLHQNDCFLVSQDAQTDNIEHNYTMKLSCNEYLTNSCTIQVRNETGSVLFTTIAKDNCNFSNEDTKIESLGGDAVNLVVCRTDSNAGNAKCKLDKAW